MSIVVPQQLDVYELGAPRPDLDDARTWACKVLPFVSVPADDPAPSSDVIRCHARVRADRVMVLGGLDYLIFKQVDVINCSLGFSRPFDPQDPLSRATRAATEAGVSVVVAAGNRGPHENSMQELAQAPWVISVGSTDKAGEPLASSSRGSREAPGPTVVADGTPPNLPIAVSIVGAGRDTVDKDLARALPGTSFAAPKVSREVAFAGKVLEASAKLVAAATVFGQDHRRGVGQTDQPPSLRMSLPVIGYVDTGVDPDFFFDADAGPWRSQLLANDQQDVLLGVTQQEWDWCQTLAPRLQGRPLAVTPEAIRRALQRMASGLDAVEWLVGAGYVTHSGARAYCADLTPSRLMSALAPELASSWPDSDLADLDRNIGSLWDDDRVALFEDLFWTAQYIAIAKVV